jgi:uncharacterized linocin/CFP29 family protein
MPNNLGHDKIPQWTDDIWNSIDKAVADEHKLTAIAAQFLTPPVPDNTMDGTVAADVVLEGDGTGILSVDESEMRSIVEIAVQFRVRQSQVEQEAQMKTAESLATRAANLVAKGEDLLIFQGLAALQDPLFKSKRIVLRVPRSQKPTSPVDAFLFDNNSQKISVKQSEPGLYGDNTYAAVAEGYSKLQENHYGRQALVLPSTIYADTFATRATTLEIPAITADRIKGLIGNFVFGSSTLPGPQTTNGQTIPGKGVLLALDGNTMDLVVQMGPTIEVVTQESASGDYIFNVYERFALRLKDPKAVVELDFTAEVERRPQ